MDHHNVVRGALTAGGTGNVTFAATASGKARPLSVLPTGWSGGIHFDDPNGVDWELSMCTALGGNVFSRDTLLHSSTGSKINLGIGAVGLQTVVAQQLNAFVSRASVAGTYAVGQVLTATYPNGIVGTIQFTRTMTAAPYTKTLISGAVASAVNSLAYTIQATLDEGYTIGVDCSNQVSTVTGGAVPAQATVKTTGVIRLFGTQNQQFESGVMTATNNSAVIKMQAPAGATGCRIAVHNKLSNFGAAGFKVAVASTELSAVDTAAHAYTPQVAGVALTAAAARSDQGFVKGTWNGATQSRRIYQGDGVLPNLGYNNAPDTVVSDVIPLVPIRATDRTAEEYYYVLRINAVCVANQDSYSQVEGGTGKMSNVIFNRWVSSNGTDCPLFCMGGMGTNVDAVDGTLVTIPGGIGNGWGPVISVEWTYPTGIVPVTFAHVGDSITEGYEWPRWAVNRKSTAARPLHHMNIGGSTTRTESFLGNMYLHLQAMAKPDYVVMPIISVNNYSPLSNFNLAAAQVEYARLQEVAQYLTTNGIKIIWWVPFNYGANPASSDTTSAWGYLYNGAKTYAAANGITWMDINGDSRLVRSVYNATSNPTGWIDPDNTHPSDPAGKTGFAAIYTDTLTALGF